MQQFALRAPAPAVLHAATRIRARARPLPAASTQPTSRRSLRPHAATRFRVSCAASESAASLPPPVSLRVVFSLRCRVEFGATLKVSGSHDALGSWDVAQALPLSWSEGDIWSCTAELPEHFVVRYKARAGGGAQTQGSRALRLRAPHTAPLTPPPPAVHRHPRRRHPAVAAGRGQHHHRQPSGGAAGRRCRRPARRLPLERKGAPNHPRAPQRVCHAPCLVPRQRCASASCSSAAALHDALGAARADGR